MAYYLYYDETGLGQNIRQNTIVMGDYIEISEELANSVYDIDEYGQGYYHGNWLSVVDGVAVHNINYYRGTKTQQLTSLFTTYNKVIVDSTSYVNVEDVESLLCAKVYFENNTSDSEYSFKAYDRETDGNKLVTFATSPLTVINNIFCAKHKYITEKEKLELQIANATTAEECEAIVIPESLPFMDLTA